jgi:hypothetical protein
MDVFKCWLEERFEQIVSNPRSIVLMDHILMTRIGGRRRIEGETCARYFDVSMAKTLGVYMIVFTGQL